MRSLLLGLLAACAHPATPLARQAVPLLHAPADLPCARFAPLGQLCACLSGRAAASCSPVRHEAGPLRYFALGDGDGSTVYAAGPGPGGWAVVARIGETQGAQELDFQASEEHVIDGHRVLWVNALWQDGETRSRTTAIVCVLGDERVPTTCPFRSLRELATTDGLRTWAIAMAVDSGIIVVSQAAGDPDPGVPVGRFRLW
jgi:hypothetical protein